MPQYLRAWHHPSSCCHSLPYSGILCSAKGTRRCCLLGAGLERGARASLQAQLLLLNEAVSAWPRGKQGPCRESCPESIKSSPLWPDGLIPRRRSHQVTQGRPSDGWKSTGCRDGASWSAGGPTSLSLSPGGAQLTKLQEAQGPAGGGTRLLGWFAGWSKGGEMTVGGGWVGKM